MKLVNFEDFFKFANFFYHTVGIEPYDKGNGYSSRTIILAATFIINFTNIFFILVAEISFIVRALRDGNNFIEAVMTLSYIGFGLLGGVKLMCVLWKRQAMTQLMHELLTIFPKRVPEQKQYKMHDYLRKCTSVTFVFSLLYMVLVWTYNLLPIMRYLILDRWLKIRQIGQTLPFILYIPWDWHGNWTYYMIYGSLCLAAWTAAAGQIPNDLMLSAAVTQVIMHYDFVANRIESYVPKGGRRKASFREKEADMEFINDMVKYHEKILRISDIMNDVFGVPLFFNFMTSSVIICFVGFQMTIGLSTDNLVKVGVFLVSSLAQVYLICHYGQKLLEASENIASAVYNQNWHDAEVRYKKMLILIAERAQKPAILKATQFLKISLKTMTDIMQLSYKFFALLRTMYSN